MRRPDFATDTKEKITCPGCGEQWEIQINVEGQLKEPDIEISVS